MNTRRAFLKTGGAMVVGLSLGDIILGQQRGAAAGTPDARQIDSWLAVHADNTATVYIGFAELGQGASTALLQVAAEELDMDLSQLKSVPLETNVTPNQGGTFSSAAIARGGPLIRTAAAEARQALLQLAARRLIISADRLTISKGVVSIIGSPDRSVTFGALIGDKTFDLPFTGNAPVKPAASYSIVGKSPMRREIPDKVRGTHVYIQHVRLPGMIHGRIVRPRGQGAYGAGSKVLSIDESSIRNIAGARVIRRGDFVGVVAESEWDAVRAAQSLKSNFFIGQQLPGSDGLYAHMRADKADESIVRERGNVGGAWAGATHIVSQNCHAPYQSHAPYGPNCAVADVTADSALVICSTQDIYALRTTLARILGLPAAKIRVQYYEGSGTYGHGCQDDVAEAAAILSKEAGKPVRLQMMRWDELGWDNYGPAHVGEARAAASADGKILAYEYHGWQHSWLTVETSEQLALGTAAAERPGVGAQGINALTLASMYEIPNLRLVNHRLNGLEYLKGAWLRSPLDLAMSFASEQAIDQLAFLLKQDPYAFRRQNMTDVRWLGVLNAVAQAAKWTPRQAASKLAKSKVVTGRGIGMGTHLASYGAAVAEIEVNRETGRVIAKRMYGAIDAGLAVNPGNIENQISGQLVQTASRMFKEEVTFSKSNVTSLDWNSYPVLRFDECPEVTPIVVQRLNERSTGAGEEVMAGAAAAIANAFFDATGLRMSQFPFTPARVLAALK